MSKINVVTHLVVRSGGAVAAGGLGMSEKEFTTEFAKSGKSKCCDIFYCRQW